MLKFFRDYILNKWTLAVGGTILMIVFLLPAGFGRQSALDNPVLGTVEGKSIRARDVQSVEPRLQVLAAFSPLLTRNLVYREGSPRLEDFDPMQWVLMRHEASAMGLDAARYEVDELLRALEVKDEQLDQLASRLRTTAAFIREALRERILIHRYMAVARGLTPTSVTEWASSLRAASMMWSQGDPSRALAVLDMGAGVLRASDRRLERFLHDAMASVKVELLMLTPTLFIMNAPIPSEQELTEHFQKYKSVAPGASEPFGFGYLVPDRLKIEYLSLPFAAVRAKVKVEEADALAFFEGNPSFFRTPAQEGRPATQRSYLEARDEVLTYLGNQRADELAQQIIRDAHALLLDDARALKVVDNYRQVPADWKPKSMAEVAQAIAGKHDILPVAVRIDDRFLSRQDLALIEGLGQSALVSGNRGTPFVDYALSVREIAVGDEALQSLRLQALLPSQPLVNRQGDRFVFRVIAAEKSREPASLEEVYSQVAFDLRRLSAYQGLLRDREKLLERFKVEDASKLAAELGTTLLTPQPFAKRVQSPDGLQPPAVSEVGVSEAFVDTVFGLSEQLGPEAFKDVPAPAAQRSAAVVLESKLSLALVRVTDYRPMTRTDYKQLASLEIVPSWMKQSMTDRAGGDPFAFETLSKRLGFKER